MVRSTVSHSFHSYKRRITETIAIFLTHQYAMLHLAPEKDNKSFKYFIKS